MNNVHHTKTAFISGASRGIGEATARRFAQGGYHLILTCKQSFQRLTDLGQELEDTYGISCRIVAADMGNEDDVKQIFQSIEDIDILINNAGIAYVGLLSDMDPSDWHQVIRVNLDACFYTCRQAIPLMLRKHQGKILNISSVWGNVGASMEVAYSASKGGVNAFTKALAKELAPSHIQVNAIAFGLIDTDMNRQLTKEELDALIRDIPTDRIGTAAEAAEMIFMTAHAPDYLTGQILTMDGGWQ
jgi:3-oxoacyl-[acyl-carrier protein] reductase